MECVSRGWKLDLQRGPDWLIVRPQYELDQSGNDEGLLDCLWELLQKHFTYRLILEMDQFPMVRSVVLGELVVLRKRICEQGGVLRICGLSEEASRVFKLTQLDHLFPNYPDRAMAIKGYRPKQPR